MTQLPALIAIGTLLYMTIVNKEIKILYLISAICGGIVAIGSTIKVFSGGMVIFYVIGSIFWIIFTYFIFKQWKKSV